MPAHPITYCLTQISDHRDFEHLCSSLLAGEGYPGIDPLGGTGDGGRDAIVRADPEGRRIIFAYTVRADWENKLNSDCDRVKELRHNPDFFVFVCNAALSATQKDRAHKKVQKNFGWKLDLFDLGRLRVLLEGRHRHLVANHPGIFPPSFFPSTADSTSFRVATLAAVQLLATLEPAVEHLCVFGQAILFAPWPTFADSEKRSKDMFDPLKPVDFDLVSKLAPFGEDIGVKIITGYRKLEKARHMLAQSLPNGGINGVIQRLPWTESRDVEFKALLSSSLGDLSAAVALLKNRDGIEP